MNTVYLHLGSNKNEPLKQLLKAFKQIEIELGKIEVISRFFKTEAWGNKNQADFINVALKLNTDFNPEELMKQVLKIEDQMGRKRVEKWGPRIIDIDIIFYNSISLSTNNLQIPHPHMTERNFVLLPLKDIAPNYIHPVVNKTIEALSIDCLDESKVILL